MNTQEILDLMKKLGLGENESRVYLALLELGPATVSTICRRAGLNRTAGYDILERLAVSNLVSYSSTKSSRKIYVAEPPGRLFQYFTQKNNAYKRRLAELKNRLADLELVAAKGEKPVIRFYEGIEGVRALYFEEEKYRGNGMLSIIDFESWDNPALRKIYLEYIKKHRHPEMAEKILLFPTETSKKWIGYFPKRIRNKIEFRFLDKEDMLNFGVDLSILNDVIWAFILKPPYFLGIRIESKPMASTLKLLYKYSWQSARPVKLKK